MSAPVLSRPKVIYNNLPLYLSTSLPLYLSTCAVAAQGDLLSHRQRGQLAPVSDFVVRAACHPLQAVTLALVDWLASLLLSILNDMKSVSFQSSCQ